MFSALKPPDLLPMDTHATNSKQGLNIKNKDTIQTLAAFWRPGPGPGPKPLLEMKNEMKKFDQEKHDRKRNADVADRRTNYDKPLCRD